MLKAAPGLGLTGLFAFHHAGIAGEKTFFSKQGAVSGIDFEESASDPEFDGPGLSGHPAAHHSHKKVVAGRAAAVLERSGRFRPRANMTAKVIIYGLLVNEEPA